MLIYRLLKYASTFLKSACILVFGYYLWRAIRRIVKSEFSFTEWIGDIRNEVCSWFGKYAKPLLMVALISTLLTNTTVHQIVGIYNLKILPAGTYCFYVEAHRIGGKTYTIPSEVKIEKETEEVGDNRERTYTYYYIERLFFSNGTEIEIDVWDSVQINESAYHTDSNGEEWELTLLNKHAYSPQMEETNNTDWFGVTLLVIEVLSVAFLLFAMYWKKSNES